MKNLSNVNIHEFLSRCDGAKVEFRRTSYEGKEYYIPYSTVKINNTLIKGLRENEERIELLTSIIENNVNEKSTYLDVGSNLGVFVRTFSFIFDNAYGVDYESYYINQAKFLYDDIKDNFQQADLNQIRLINIFPGKKFDTITALSMIEYIHNKKQFVGDLFDLTRGICIVEGHSEDIKLGHDKTYENILKSFDWTVTRLEQTTDVGINAPVDTFKYGRPLWLCKK